MSREMTSFVLRFVREASEEQGARWRGMVQHVQGGTEHNFTTFPEAVQFMQERVLENTARTLKGEETVMDNPFADAVDEMTKMWGDWGTHVAEMWTETAEQMMGRSTAFRSQVDQAVAATLKTWGLPTGADQEAILASLDRLASRVDELTARVEALETKLTASKSPSKRGRANKGKTAESDSQV